MTRLLKFVSALALALACSRAAPGAPATQAASFLIVNPAGQGNQGLATGFLADFSKALAASWPTDGPACPELRGRYHVSETDALASIRREKPAFALVSPGFHARHRDDLHLVPLLSPVRREGEGVVRVIGRGGRDLAGTAQPARIGGQLAAEPDWLLGPVLGPDLSWLGKQPPLLVPVARSLEAVRMAERGELDLVVLHDAEWLLLQRTGKAAGWHVVRTSPTLPEGPVVAFSEAGPVASAAARALRAFPSTPQGRAVLERMTLRGFEPFSADAWARVPPLAAAGAIQ